MKLLLKTNDSSKNIDRLVQSNNNTHTTIFIVIALLLLVTNYSFSININEFIYVGVFSIVFLLSKKEEIIEMLCFFFPIASLVTSVTYIWLIVLIILVAKSQFRIRVNRAVIIAFFALLEFIAHMVYGISDINRMGGYILCMAIMFYLLYEKGTSLNYRRCLYLYAWGVFVLCALYLENAIMHAPLGWMSMMATGSLRFGGAVNSAFENMAIDLNANSLAYYALTGTATSIVLLKVNKTEELIYKMFFIAQALFVTLAGALTISRSWLLVIAIIILMLYLSESKTKSNFIKYSVIAFIIVIAFMLVVAQGDNFIVDAFISRFTNGEIKGAGGRSDIFSDYMRLFFQNDLFIWLGTGVTDYVDVIHMWQSIHMGVQQIMICLGIPGAIIFLISILYPIIFAFKEKVKLLFWIPIVSVVLFTQTIQFLNPWGFMLPYAISVYALRFGTDFNNLKYH